MSKRKPYNKYREAAKKNREMKRNNVDITLEDVRKAEDEIKAWRKVPSYFFAEVPETFYLATPYLKMVRENREWSLRDMAERAGISVNYYHDFERGKRRASEEFVEKIRRALL
jgi:ribosome-binding protein aMBF1 (putative translation factor)